MIPVAVPAEAKAAHPEGAVVDMAPPPGVSHAHCGTAQMLTRCLATEGFTAPTHYAYFRPTAEDLAVLNAGGFLELAQIGNGVQPFALNVMSADHELPHEDAAADGAAGLGEAGGRPAADTARDGADSHDVGPTAPEAASAAEEGGTGEPVARPAPAGADH